MTSASSISRSGPSVALRAQPLQVVYVNYFSADVLSESIASVRAYTAGGTQITVVDNSCDDEEFAKLESLDIDQRFRSEENVGFARACNRGARAGRSSMVLFLNPDTVVQDGAFPAMGEALRRQPNALVGPQQFADRELRFAHAPLRGPGWFDEVGDLAWARGWRPERPLRYLTRRARGLTRGGVESVPFLSGGCLGMTRATFDALGGWNEAYWMYGEDMEFSARARRRGHPLLLQRDARVIHFMEHSARRLPERVQASREAGRQRFKRAMHWRLGAAAQDAALRLASRLLPTRRDEWSCAPLQNITIRRPAASRWAVEMARSPLFDNCLTAITDEAELRLPTELTSGLPPGHYYLQVAAHDADRWRRVALHSLTVPRRAP